MGIPTPQFDADGKVILGLQIADTWAGFKAPRVTGNAELHSVRGKIRGLNTTIEIGAAKVILNPEEVTVQSLTASAGGTTWHGSLVLPRPCGLMGTCPIQMDLHADEIATDRVAKILGAQDAQRPWYGFLMTSRKSPYLLGLRATGHLAADRVIVHKLAGTDVSANFDLERGRLRLKNLRGTVFGGTQSGEWTLDFTVRPPAYSGEGSFEHVSLAQLATAMHDNWIAGTAAATYHVTASGWSAGELFSSATGILQIEARDGIMPHMLSPNFAGPLQFRHFAGGLVLRHNELDFIESRLTANGGVYDVTGTASLGRSIDLKLLRSGNRGFSITGTLSAPVVSTSAVPATQAALKP
jgi:hypothetical protein